MLELAAVEARYGAATALWNVSLTLRPGELVCVVGPNGAGKSTLINVIAGMHRIWSGSLMLGTCNLAKLPAHHFCREGIAIVPEGRRLFGAMTVKENLELGSYLAGARARRNESLERVCAMFPMLATRLESSGRGPVGRPAADGGDRACAHGPTARAAVGRAIARPRADHCVGGLKEHSTDQRAKAWPCCLSSRTSPWRSTWQTGPTCWRRAALPRRAHPKNCLHSLTSDALTWGSSPTTRNESVEIGSDSIFADVPRD